MEEVPRHVCDSYAGFGPLFFGSMVTSPPTLARHTGIDAGFGRDWDHQEYGTGQYPENAPNYYDHQLISTDGGEPEMVKLLDGHTDWAIDFIEQRKQVGGNHGTCGLHGAVHGPFLADRHLERYSDIDVPVPVCVSPRVRPHAKRRWNFGNVGQRQAC